MRISTLMGILLIVLILVSMPLLSACGGDDEEESTPTEQPTETVAPPETTETVAPPETTETVAPPETTETVAPPETTETVAPPETTETVAPPETTETVAPPETTETAEPAERKYVGASWQYQVTYGDDPKLESPDVTNWTTNVTGLETIEGVDTYVCESTFDATPRRYFYVSMMGMDFPVDLSSSTFWRSTTTLDPVKEEFSLTVIGMGLSLSAARPTVYEGTDHNAPLSEGKTWTYTQIIDMPDYGFHEETTFTAEVVGIEDVTVPMGTISCYKVTQTSDAGTNIEWWDVDGQYLTPVKIVHATTFVGTETFELVSYTPAE